MIFVSTVSKDAIEEGNRPDRWMEAKVGGGAGRDKRFPVRTFTHLKLLCISPLDIIGEHRPS